LDEAKSTEGRLALFVAQHTSINIVDHLTDLCKNCFKKCDSSTYLQMHRTKCSNVIKNVWAPHFMKELCEDVGETPFSILLPI
jgi:hypothetical protein